MSESSAGQGGTILIKGAQIFDGSGRESFRGDLFIRDGRIAGVGEVSSQHADTVIDAGGLAAAPGFVDIHGHSDLTLLADRRGLSKLFQGITTEACGQCGMAPFPVPQGERQEFEALLAYSWAPVDISWRDVAGYLEAADREPIGINLCPFLGINVLVAISGAEPDDPGPALGAAQMAGVEELWGVSMGVAYEPLYHWPTDALRPLAELARGKTLASHIRNEGSGLVESIMEMIEILPPHTHLEIAHLKASGRSNWGKVNDALEAIEQAAARGIDIGYNAYPYTAGSTFLAATLPDWLTKEGQAEAVEMLRRPDVRERLRQQHQKRPTFPRLEPEQVLVASTGTEEMSWAEGKSLAEVAREMGKDAHEAAVEIVLRSGGKATAVFFTMSEDDVRTALKHPMGSICTDGLAFCPDGPGRIGHPHPRSYGAFPRFIGRYCREEGLLGMAEAVRKCTSLPAGRLGLKDRGLLREGYVADVVLFDPDRVMDTATYAEPHRLSEGIEFVIVGGVVSVAEGKFTGRLGGKVLRYSVDGKLAPS